MDLPLDLTTLADPLVAAAVAGLLAQWLKHYLPDWRYTNLLVLVLAVALEIAVAAITHCAPWPQAAWAGFVGASIATFGYESIANVGGAIGFGDRAVKATRRIY